MSGLNRLMGSLLVLAAAAIPLRAATPVKLKLATQAPTGTIWEKELKNLGSTLFKTTEGRVVLTVFADGSQGTESATVTKMRGNTIEASLLTAGGLADIDKAFNVFTITFFFD